MANPYERVKSAWALPDGRLALHRAVEEMAAEGVLRDELDDALGRLLDDVRAAGAGEADEEVIQSVGDRLHGWCHVSRHIAVREAPATPSPTVTAPGRPNAPTQRVDQPATK